MKITGLNYYVDPSGGNVFTFTVEVGSMGLLTALMRVQDALERDAAPLEHPATVLPNTGPSAPAPASTPSTEPAEPTGSRRRQPRTAPVDPTPKDEPKADAPAETSSRRRRPTEAPATEAPVITDLDLSKAASIAAATLAGLGENGPAIVMTILKEDHGVGATNDIAPGEREKFLKSLKDEVALAEAEKNKAA